VEDWRSVVTAMVRACRAGGVIAISTPNPRWAAPLWALERMKLKMPEGPHHFVPAGAIVSALRESGCRLRQSQTHLVLPANLAGLGGRVSKLAERLPLLRGLGVIQMIVAEKT